MRAKSDTMILIIITMPGKNIKTKNKKMATIWRRKRTRPNGKHISESVRNFVLLFLYWEYKKVEIWCWRSSILRLGSSKSTTEVRVPLWPQQVLKYLSKSMTSCTISSSDIRFGLAKRLMLAFCLFYWIYCDFFHLLFVHFDFFAGLDNSPRILCDFFFSILY